MAERVLEFFVPGTPISGGSKTAVPFKRRDGSLGARVTDSAGAKNKDWKAMVAFYGEEANDHRDLLAGPLRVWFLFTHPRLKGHYGTGKNAGRVKITSPTFKITKPDTTKLIRAAEDALSGIVWRDDAIIVQQLSQKIFGEKPGVHIIIETLDVEDVIHRSAQVKFTTRWADGVKRIAQQKG